MQQLWDLSSEAGVSAEVNGKQPGKKKNKKKNNLTDPGKNTKHGVKSAKPHRRWRCIDKYKVSVVMSCNVDIPAPQWERSLNFKNCDRLIMNDF